MSITKYREPFAWTPGHNPVVFGFTTDHTDNTATDEYAIIGVTSDAGFAKIETGAAHDYVVGDYVRTMEDKKVYLVTAVADTTHFTVDAKVSDVVYYGLVAKYFNNHSIVLELYQVPSNGSLLADGTEILIATLTQRADKDNNFIFDLAPILNKYIDKDLQDITDTSVIADASNSWSGYFVKYAEQYDIPVSGEPVLTLQPMKFDQLCGEDMIDVDTTDIVGEFDPQGGGNPPWSASSAADGSVVVGLADGTQSEYMRYDQDFTDCANVRICFLVTGLKSGVALDVVVETTGTIQYISTNGWTCIPYTAAVGGFIQFAAINDSGSEATITVHAFKMYCIDCVNVLDVHNSANQYLEQLAETNKLEPYILNSGETGVPFLSLYPRNLKKKIYAGQNEFLGFITNYADVFKILYRTYDADMVFVDNGLSAGDNVVNGRYDASCYFMPTTSEPYYSITIIDTTNFRRSEEFMFEVDYCPPAKSVRLKWLNTLGAFEWLNLTGEKVEGIEVTRIGEIKRALGIDGYQPPFRQRDTLATTMRDTFVLNTGYLREAELEWAKGLLYSSAVFMERVIDDVSYDVPLNVKSDKVVLKSSKDKLWMLTIECEAAWDGIVP